MRCISAWPFCSWCGSHSAPLPIAMTMSIHGGSRSAPGCGTLWGLSGSSFWGCSRSRASRVSFEYHDGQRSSFSMSRRTPMKRACFLAAAALCLAFATAYAEDDAVVKEGDKARDFKLQGSDGKDYSLKQFAGKKAVVIAWFPKAF